MFGSLEKGIRKGEWFVCSKFFILVLNRTCSLSPYVFWLGCVILTEIRYIYTLYLLFAIRWKGRRQYLAWGHGKWRLSRTVWVWKLCGELFLHTYEDSKMHQLKASHFDQSRLWCCSPTPGLYFTRQSVPPLIHIKWRLFIFTPLYTCDTLRPIPTAMHQQVPPSQVKRFFLKGENKPVDPADFFFFYLARHETSQVGRVD